jgi:xanthine dehydrogenase accessory factor
MRELLAELSNIVDQGRACVYCCVVETRGSTPQKAGATMLVFPDGSQRGTLGGGCVEAEVKQRALRVLTQGEGRPEILTFSLDDNYGWDDGLICGGRMTILADPVARISGQDRSTETPAYYRRFYEMVTSGAGCTEAVVINAQSSELPLGSRFLFDATGQLAGRLLSSARNDGTLTDAAAEVVARHLAPIATRPRPAVHHGVAYLPILSRITLFIVGGGHVGQAVARLAAEVDFNIWVLDDRETYACKERFPAAERIVVGDIGGRLQDMALRDITPSTYCLIVTRGHHHDEEALYHLAPSSAGYVGMIGSKRKIKLIYEDLMARGIFAETLNRVHAPLGIDIGSQTLPEIAVSIVAELIACRNRGSAPGAAGPRSTTQESGRRC